MPHEDPGWLADWRAIQVDTGSVQQLATALVTEVHGNLEPHVGAVYQGYAVGTAFGKSLAVAAARAKLTLPMGEHAGAAVEP